MFPPLVDAFGFWVESRDAMDFFRLVAGLYCIERKVFCQTNPQICLFGGLLCTEYLFSYFIIIIGMRIYIEISITFYINFKKL